MATLHKGRRPALIPSMESLSPEEVRDVLCNRIGRPLVPPPDSGLAISAAQGQIVDHQTWRLHKVREPPFEGIFKLDSAQSLRRPDTEGDRPASSSTLPRGNVDRPVRWIQAEENARGKDSDPETVRSCRGPKRKHAVYARDEQRRYSNEMWEDIPHMSEIESDHSFPTFAKDVFGLKGQRSLFADVCHPPSSERSPRIVPADQRRQDGHPKRAWLFRFHTARRPASTPFHLGTHPPRAHLSGVCKFLLEAGLQPRADDSGGLNLCRPGARLGFQNRV